MSTHTYEDAHVQLEVLGEIHELSVQVAVGQARLDDLLPVAKQISRQVSSIVAARAAAEGQRGVVCAAGCSACCHHLIPISPLEARSLTRLVSRLPGPRRQEVRRRFGHNIARMEELGWLDPNDPPGRWFLRSPGGDQESLWERTSRAYFHAHLACPLLSDDDRCAMYEQRPCVCGEHGVTTPVELCATLNGHTRSVARPLRMEEVLVATANELVGADLLAIPLPLALEWTAIHGQQLDRWLDGEAMFWALMRQCQAAASGSR